MVVITETFSEKQQGYELKKVVFEGGHKFQIRVYRDSYDFQSVFVIKLWIADKGWVEVHAIGGDTKEGKSMPSHHSPNKALLPKASNVMASLLLKIALQIVG